MLMTCFGTRSLCILAVATALLSSVSRAQEPPKTVDDLERQVQQYLREQKPREAIPVLREILSLDPKNVNALGNLGVLLFFDGNYQEAIPSMREAVRLQ